jgi:hypothetical protein
VVFTYIQEYYPTADEDVHIDEFTLESTDGNYKQIHDITSGSVSKEGVAAIAFTDVLPGKNYTLIYRNRETGDSYPRFSDMPFYNLFSKARGGL